MASDVFNRHMPTPNQIFKRREGETAVSAMDLLNMNMPGVVSEAGIRSNLVIGLSYMESWLRGVGCVPINFLMEDAATAEVSRSQVRFHCCHCHCHHYYHYHCYHYYLLLLLLLLPTTAPTTPRPTPCYYRSYRLIGGGDSSGNGPATA